RGGSKTYPELLKRIDELQQRNDELTAKLNEDSVALDSTLMISGLASPESTFELHGRHFINGRTQDWRCKLSWNQIMAAFGPRLFSSISDSEINEVFAMTICASTGQAIGDNIVTDFNCLDTVAVQLTALGYINVESGVWELTPLGRKATVENRSIKVA